MFRENVKGKEIIGVCLKFYPSRDGSYGAICRFSSLFERGPVAARKSIVQVNFLYTIWNEFQRSEIYVLIATHRLII